MLSTCMRRISSRTKFKTLRTTFFYRRCSSGPEKTPPINPDGLTRYPELNSPQGLLRLGDWIGTSAFASTGAVCAASSGMDILGCTVVGTITAVGGGTVRDVLIGNSPVFWVIEWEYIAMCIATCIATFLVWDEDSEIFKRNSVSKVSFWADAGGLGVFCVIGAQNGIRAGCHPLICILCGMITATFGGVIRDTLCKRPVRILHSHAEIYATSALLGATTFVGLRALGVVPVFRIGAAVATAAATRYLAVEHHITLPTKESADKKVA